MSMTDDELRLLAREHGADTPVDDMDVYAFFPHEFFRFARALIAQSESARIAELQAMLAECEPVVLAERDMCDIAYYALGGESTRKPKAIDDLLRRIREAIA